MAYISGKWEWATTLKTKNAPSGSHSINFTSGGSSWDTILISLSEDGDRIAVNYLYPSESRSALLATYGGTTDVQYRIIDFGETPQSVSDDFYNWVVASTVSETTKYTLKGRWEVTTAFYSPSVDFEENILFTCDNGTVKYECYKVNKQFIYTDQKIDGFTIWEAFGTIGTIFDFGAVEQVVSDVFYFWFTSVATKANDPFRITYKLTNCTADATNPTQAYKGDLIILKFNANYGYTFTGTSQIRISGCEYIGIYEIGDGGNSVTVSAVNVFSNLVVTGTAKLNQEIISRPFEFYPRRTVEEQANRLPEELREPYRNSQIDRIKIFDGTQEIEVMGYAEYSYLDEKSYKTQPIRSQDGSIVDIDEYATFLTPRLVIRYNMMGIDDYRSLMKMLKRRNGFIVKCYDVVENEIVKNEMYVAPSSMPRIYQQYLIALGIQENTIEMIGTNYRSKIEFRVLDNGKYYADFGHTWREFINTPYNQNAIFNLYSDDRRIRFGETWLCDLEGTTINADDYIRADGLYDIR